MTTPADVAAYDAQTAVEAARVAVEAANSIPKPTPAPAPLIAEAELGALRRLSPRRNLWPEVLAFDERTREIDARQRTLAEEVAELDARIQAAERADREALAEWALEQTGPRPQFTAPALAEERDAQAKARDSLDATRWSGCCSAMPL